MKSLIGTLLNKTPVSFPTERQSFGWFGSKKNTTSYLSQYSAVGTLFAIVNSTSNYTSQVDWKLWRKSRSGMKEDRVEVTSHAALDLWNKPNRFYTRQEFVEAFQQHIDLTGEGWWVVGRNPVADIPLELWVVRPDHMTPVPSPTEFLSGYFYSGPDGEQVPLGLDEVIQLRMPNPLDLYRGMGPVQSILVDLDSARYSAEWNRNFFINGAEPGGIIQVDKSLSDDEFNELRNRWNETHKGVANAHRVALLEHGEWKSLNFSQRDMQFVELRNASREVIREAFAVTKFDVGEIDDVNRATAEASEVRWSKRLIVPRLERIKGALNNDLLPMFGTSGQGLEFDYEDPTPPDHDSINSARDSKTSAYKTLVDAGVDPDDAARVVGLPPMKNTGRQVAPVGGQ